jgi:MFS family permease
MFDSKVRKVSFFSYLIGQTISSLGDGLYLIAFVWLSFQLSDNKGLTLGGVFSIYTLGELLAGCLSGPIVDRFNKKLILIHIDLIRGSISGFLFAIVSLGAVTLLHLYLCTFLFSLLSAFFHRTEFAIIPQIVRREDLLKANGLLCGLKKLMIIVSPIIGGFLVQMVDIEICFLCDAISFFFSSICISFVFVNKNLQRLRTTKSLHLLKDFGTGCKIVLYSPFLLTIAIYAACINFVGAPIFPLLPIISSRLANGVSTYGIMISGLSVGLVVSGFSFALISKLMTKIYMTLYGLIICSAAIAALACGRSPTLIIVSCFAIGVGLNFANLPIQAILQEKLPADKIGVASSFIFTIAQIAMPISMASSGFMIQHLKIELVLVLLGSLMFVGAITGFFLPQFRGEKKSTKTS